MNVKNMTIEERKEFLQENLKLFSEKMQKYHGIIQDILEVNPLNVTEKSMMASSAHQSILTCYYTEQVYLNKLQIFRKKKIEQLIKEYGESNKPRYEVEDFVKKSAEVQDLDNKIFEQEFLIQYLKDNLESVFKGFAFNIKSCIDCLKLEK
jgi:hypothetical protein